MSGELPPLHRALDATTKKLKIRMNNKITIAKFYLVSITLLGCLISYLLNSKFTFGNMIMGGLSFLCICIVAGISFEFINRKILTTSIKEHTSSGILDSNIPSEREQLAIDKINLYFNKFKFAFYFSLFAFAFLLLKKYV